MLRPYEVTIVLDSHLTDDEGIKIIEKFQSLIEKSQGKIDHTVLWGRKKLGYEIRKKRHGIFGVTIQLCVAPSVEKPLKFLSTLAFYLAKI